MDNRAKIALLAVSLMLLSGVAVYAIYQIAPLDPLAQFRTADGHLSFPGGALTAEIQRLLFPGPAPKDYTVWTPVRSAYPTLAIQGIKYDLPVAAHAPKPIKPLGTDSFKVFFDALLRIPKDILSFFMTDASAACTGGACFWIGGTGNFTDNTHWSLLSGGVACVCTPGATDSVTFDASSGAGTATQNNVTFTSGAVVMTNSSVTIAADGGSSHTWKVGGSWSDHNSHYSRGISAVEFTANGSIYGADTYAGSGTYDFYDMIVDLGVTTSMNASGTSILIYHGLTVNGTLSGTGGQYWEIINTQSTPITIGGSGSVSGSGNIVYVLFGGNTTPINLAGTTYPSLIVEGNTAAVTANFAGDITATTVDFGDYGGAQTNDHFPVSTANFNLTATNIYIGANGGGTLSLGSSTVTNTGDFATIGGTGADSALIMGSATFNKVSGPWANTSTSTAWNAGTSTVIFKNQLNFVTQTFGDATNYVGGVEFNNVTFDSNAATTGVTKIGSHQLKLSGTLSITDTNAGGTVELNDATNNMGITAGSINVGARGLLTAGSATITINGAITMTNANAVNGGSATWKVGGSWSDANTHWSMSTSTVEFTATGTLTLPDTNGAEYFYNFKISAGTMSMSIAAGNHRTGIARAFSVTGGTLQDDGSGTGITIYSLNDAGSTTFFTYSGGSILATAVGRLTLDFDNSGGASPNIQFPGGTYTHVNLYFESRNGTNATFTLTSGINTTDGSFGLSYDGVVTLDTGTFNMTIGILSVTTGDGSVHHMTSTSGTWAIQGMAASLDTNWYWTAGSISVTDTGGCGGGCSYRNGSANNSWDGSSATYTYTGSTGGVWRPGSFTTAIEWGTLIMDTGGAYTLTMENNGMRVGTLTVRNTHATTTILDTDVSNNYSINATSVTIGSGGTITARAATITVGGNWNGSAGTFTKGTSTIVFSESGNLTTDAGSGDAKFHNITINAGKMVTLQNRWGWSGTFTINGTWNANGNLWDARGSTATPIVFGGSASIINGGTISWLLESSGTYTVAARTDWGHWRFQPLASNVILSIGAGSTTLDAMAYLCGSGTGEIRTNAHTFSATSITTTVDGACGMNFGAGGSTVSVTGAGATVVLGSGIYFNLGGATVTIAGTWTNNSTSASWSSGSGSVTFTSATGGTMVFGGSNLPGDEFNTLAFASSGGSSQTFTLSTRGLRWGSLMQIYSATVVNKGTQTLTNSGGELRIASDGSVSGLISTSGAVQVFSFTVSDAAGYVVLGSETWTVLGSWSNSSTSASWSAGTGTVNFTGSDPENRGFDFAGTNLAGSELNNVTFQSSAGTAKTFRLGFNAARGLHIAGDLTISDSSSTTTLNTQNQFANNSNITAANITIGSGGIVLANSSVITATGNWDSSAGTFTFGTSLVMMTGAGKTVQTTFYDLEIDGSVTALIPLVVTHDLLVTGSLNLAGLALTVGHNLTDNGTLSNIGSTTLNGSSVQTITGTENIHLGPTTVSGAEKDFTSDFTTANVTKSGGTNVTMAISPGVIWSIPDDTTLEGGGPTSYLVLRSGTSGSAWLLHPGVSSKGNFVDVQDSTSSFPMVCTYFCVDSGRNTNWVFNAGGGGGGGGGQPPAQPGFYFATPSGSDLVLWTEIVLVGIVALGLAGIFIFRPQGKAKKWAWIIVAIAALALVLIYFAPMFFTFG